MILLCALWITSAWAADIASYPQVGEVQLPEHGVARVVLPPDAIGADPDALPARDDPVGPLPSAPAIRDSMTTMRS